MHSHPPHWLLIVRAAPTSMPALAAQQLACAALDDGIQVTVFFHADGVYHALPVTAMDVGSTALHDAYTARLAQTSAGADNALRLLLCRASLSRRSQHGVQPPWQNSGLTELAELLQCADRVISFVD